jgi:hypothetical protein
MPLDGENALASEIAQLRDLGLQDLQTRWRNRTGRRAPAHLGKGLLLRLLAYRLQADAYGDLDPATMRFLDRVAAEPDNHRGKNLPQPDSDRVRPGAVLVREWEGTSHRVMALADGYAWNGQTYRSLSEVARAITGTRWNGPRFFGLRDQDRDRKSS